MCQTVRAFREIDHHTWTETRGLLITTNVECPNPQMPYPSLICPKYCHHGTTRDDHVANPMPPHLSYFLPRDRFYIKSHQPLRRVFDRTASYTSYTSYTFYTRQRKANHPSNPSNPSYPLGNALRHLCALHELLLEARRVDAELDVAADRHNDVVELRGGPSVHGCVHVRIGEHHLPTERESV